MLQLMQSHCTWFHGVGKSGPGIQAVALGEVSAGQRLQWEYSELHYNGCNICSIAIVTDVKYCLDWWGGLFVPP